LKQHVIPDGMVFDFCSNVLDAVVVAAAAVAVVVQ